MTAIQATATKAEMISRNERIECFCLAGPPTWRKGSIAPFVDLSLCNACGIFEDRHGESLLDCSEPVRVITYTHARCVLHMMHSYHIACNIVIPLF